MFHNWLGPLWDQWDSTWNTVEAIEEYKQNNEKAKSAGSIPECFGFAFDNSEYKTEIAAVGAVMSAGKPILETGSAENFDTYLKELNDKLTRAGIDTLVEAVNRQYNEWLAENKK